MSRLRDRIGEREFLRLRADTEGATPEQFARRWRDFLLAVKDDL